MKVDKREVFKLKPGMHFIHIPEPTAVQDYSVVHHALADSACLDDAIAAFRYFLAGCSYAIAADAELKLDSASTRCCEEEDPSV